MTRIIKAAIGCLLLVFAQRSSCQDAIISDQLKPPPLSWYKYLDGLWQLESFKVKQPISKQHAVYKILHNSGVMGISLTNSNSYRTWFESPQKGETIEIVGNFTVPPPPILVDEPIVASNTSKDVPDFIPGQYEIVVTNKKAYRLGERTKPISYDFSKLENIFLEGKILKISLEQIITEQNILGVPVEVVFRRNQFDLQRLKKGSKNATPNDANELTEPTLDDKKKANDLAKIINGRWYLEKYEFQSEANAENKERITHLLDDIINSTSYKSHLHTIGDLKRYTLSFMSDSLNKGVVTEVTVQAMYTLYAQRIDKEFTMGLLLLSKETLADGSAEERKRYIPHNENAEFITMHGRILKHSYNQLVIKKTIGLLQNVKLYFKRFE